MVSLVNRSVSTSKRPCDHRTPMLRSAGRSTSSTQRPKPSAATAQSNWSRTPAGSLRIDAAISSSMNTVGCESGGGHCERPVSTLIAFSFQTGLLILRRPPHQRQHLVRGEPTCIISGRLRRTDPGDHCIGLDKRSPAASRMRPWCQSASCSDEASEKRHEHPNGSPHRIRPEPRATRNHSGKAVGGLLPPTASRARIGDRAAHPAAGLRPRARVLRSLLPTSSRPTSRRSPVGCCPRRIKRPAVTGPRP